MIGLTVEAQGGMHDSFEEILGIRGVLDGSVAATASKWPSFMGSYAGTVHMLQRSHGYVQYRRSDHAVAQREVQPALVPEPTERRRRLSLDSLEEELALCQ